MSLGDFFPDNLKKDFASRNIDLGNAVLIQVPELSINYDKYIIVVAKDDELVSIAYVIINTDININVAFTPYLKSLHLKIDRIKNPFLKHDSFVDCSKLREFPIKSVVDFLTNNPEKAIGNVSEDTLKQIHLTITNAKTIEPIIKKKFGFL